MKFKVTYKGFFLWAFLLNAVLLFGQEPVVRTPQGAVPNNPLPNRNNQGQSDSLRRRNNLEDSITLRIYYLDSSRAYLPDSSLNDWTKRFPIPATHIYLGNTGSPTRSLLFMPVSHIGWDPGFHALDIYRRRLESARFFNSTRPYTELGYTLGSRTEQIIEVLHTQNIKPHWNASFNYRLINNPGVFRNQRTNHNNYVFTSWYQSPAKRYNNYFVLLFNKMEGAESGGIRQDKDYLRDPVYSRDRFSVPTNIGGEPTFASTSIYTGRREKDFNIFIRQQYDFGRKDSIITDSTVIPLFYPRLRVEHNLKFSSYDYFFHDFLSVDLRHFNRPDSAAAYYATNYNLTVPQNDSISFRDHWREISNDFSFYQFPDVNNLQQFIKLGAELQLLKGELKTTETFYNITGHAEYRNRTKNQKWDMLAFGRLLLAGTNAGDYHAYISLQRTLGRQFNSLRLGFENINRSPSFIFNPKSNFYLDAPKSFGKENTIHFFASVLEPKFRLQLTGDYYLVSNYLYLKNYYRLQQESALFNILRVGASKTFKLSRYWNWYADIYLQQKTGAAELNLPFFFTRNRVAFEGNFFRNLNVSTGVELRYYSPYKADNYSPLLGQFFYQDSTTISNRPDIAAFFHMRIRSFKAYVRAENLNTVSTRDGFGFNNNNLAAPGYPTPGLIMRLGIYWSFVN